MLNCANCGCTNFYEKLGYSFCVSCQMQSQDVRQEMEMEIAEGLENALKLRKKRMGGKKDEAELGWTSWELYNFVMIGLTNELIDLGASIDIKLTVLQLWARYLGKLEVAFMSTQKKLMPKLSRRFKNKDAEIIYGKILSNKKIRKQRKTEENKKDSNFAVPTDETSTEFCGEIDKTQNMRELTKNKKLMITEHYEQLQPQKENLEENMASNPNLNNFQSDSMQVRNERLQFNYFAKKETKKVKDLGKKVVKYKRSKYKQNYVTSQYASGPELITPMKLWAILYLALRIHNQDIHLGDMIRYAREGHLSYYKLDHLIPPEVILTRNDISFLSRAIEITHYGMRCIIGKMAKFLGVFNIICPDFSSFITRYCTELHLPRGISLYTERLVALSTPKMKFVDTFCIPNYEGRAMAFIIVVMKTLLGLDGVTEYEISKVAAKINRMEYL